MGGYIKFVTLAEVTQVFFRSCRSDEAGSAPDESSRSQIKSLVSASVAKLSAMIAISV